MSYAADLTPSRFGAFSSLPDVLAIGWLSAARPYVSGPVPASVLERLAELELAIRAHHECPLHPLGTVFIPIAAGGWHECEICVRDGNDPSRSSYEMLIEGGGRRFEAPLMIVHYIESHGYQPPSDFVDAVASADSLESLLSAQARAVSEVLAVALEATIHAATPSRGSRPRPGRPASRRRW